MKKRSKKVYVTTTIPKAGKEIVENKKVGMIQIRGIKDVEMCEIAMETDDKTFALVSDLGRKMVTSDKKELFGYAIRRAIEDVIEQEKAERAFKLT